MVLAIWTVLAGTAHGQIFVAYDGAYNGDGGVAEYSLSGQTINTRFIYGYDGIGGLTMDENGNLWVANTLGAGVDKYTTSGTYLGQLPLTLATSFGPGAMAADGTGNLFVANPEVNVVGEFTTSGAIVNSSVISGIPLSGLAAAGNSLFVENGLNGTIMEYTTSGELVNPSLITGASGPLVCDGNGHLFVGNANGTIGEYNTSGQAINASLITGLSSIGSLALDGNGNLFVLSGDTIGEYTTSGETLNASLVTVTGLVGPTEPSSVGLLVLGLGSLWVGLRRSSWNRSPH
jgi:ligand-binding sensor domain-containing protein